MQWIVLDDFHEYRPQLGIELIRQMHVRTCASSNRAEPGQVRIEENASPQLLGPLLLRSFDQNAQQKLLCNPWLRPTTVEELQQLPRRVELRNTEIDYLFPVEDCLAVWST